MQSTKTAPFTPLPVSQRQEAVSQAFPNFLHNTLLFFLAFIYSGLFFLLVSVSPLLLYGFYFALGLIAFLCLATNRLPIGSFKAVMPYLLWIMFYATWGTLASPYIGVVLPEVIRMVLRTFLILAGVAIALQKKGDVTRLSGFIQVAAIFNFIISVWEGIDPNFIQQIASLLNNDFARFADYRPAGLWVDPNEAAFAFLFAFLMSRWCPGLLGWLGRFACLGGIYLTVSRSGTYLLIICLVVLLFSKIKSFNFNLRNVAIGVNLLALLLIVASSLYFLGVIKVNVDFSDQWNISRLLDFSESSNQNNAQYTRGDVVSEGISLAFEGDWYGYGIFSFQGNSNLSGDFNTVLVNRIGVGAHNIYIVAMGELGFLGILGYFLVLVLGLRQMLRAKLATNVRVTLSLLWVSYLLIGFALHLQFTSVSFMIYSALLFRLPLVLGTSPLANPEKATLSLSISDGHYYNPARGRNFLPALWRGVSAKWRAISVGSTNRNILRAAITLGIMTLGVKVVATLKDMVTSAYFGTGDALDAYLIAFLLPTFIIGVLVTPFSSALIPTYVQVRDADGKAAAQQLFSKVLVLTTGLLATVSLPLALLAPKILSYLASGFSPAKLVLTQELFYLMLPILILSGLTGLWSSILNAEERFSLSSLVPGLVPLVSIISLLTLYGFIGIFALALGTLVGFLLQAIWLGIAIRRHGLKLRPAWPGNDPALRQVIRQYIPVMVGSILLSSTGVIDQAIGAVLVSGSVAALNYGSKIVALITGILTVAIATAVLPYFSRLVAAADWRGARHTLKTYTRLILFTTLPLTALLCIFSPFIIHLLYERGAFTPHDTQVVSQVQTMYVLQIPFYTLAMLYSRLISALRANTFLMWGTAISCILNVLLDLVLVRPLGIAGIALSTTLVYIVSFGFLYYFSHRLLTELIQD